MQSIGKSLEGQRLGHFELQECIGGGGMGVVFRGLDTTLGRTVAVKVVSNDTTDEETLRRFRNEAQSAARLDHPNIARVYYVGEDRGWNYIVFEYIDGVNVRDLIEKRGPLPLDEAISYTLQVAEALGHAAQREVVHRDIKPSNILVMADGRAKLVDMGLARLHQVESNANDLTATGVTLGTFDYISPEQARDPRTADVRSDLYSLGCTLYFMLTGLPPFPEGTVLQKLLNHSSEPPRDPRDIRGDLSEEIAAVVLRLMAKQPAQRFQTPQELLGALVAVAEHHGIGLGGYATSVWVPAQHTWVDRIERHLPWVVPTLLLLVAIYAVEVWEGPDPVIRLQMTPDVRAAHAADAAPVVLVPPTSGESSSPASQEPGILEETDAATAVPPKSSAAVPLIDAHPSSSAHTARTVPLVSQPTGAKKGTNGPGAEHSGETPLYSPEKPPAPRAIQSTPSLSHNAVLIVRPDAVPDESSNIVDSLETAFRRAALSSTYSVIELHFDQSEERPRTLQAPSTGTELTVRAGEGYRPLITFRPNGYGLGAENRMLNLIGGSVAWEGIHFRLEVPNEMSDGWSLFHLNQVDSLRMSNCTLTVSNPFLSRAAFFSIQGPRETGIESSAASGKAVKTPKMVLENCLARGQASLVRSLEGLPFWLTWRQGFLATTDYLIEAGGLSPLAVDDVMRVTMSNVTAAVNRGMVRLELREAGPALPELALDCNNCVFVHPREVPLVEYRGAIDSKRAVELFEIDGRDNFYDFTEIRWRIHGPEGVRDFSWEEQDESWYREKRAERGLRWRNPLPTDRDVSLRTPRDYLLDSNESQVAGFNLEQLPAFPEVSPRSG